MEHSVFLTETGREDLAQFGLLPGMLLASEPGESWGAQWPVLGVFGEPARFCYLLGPFH